MSDVNAIFIPFDVSEFFYSRSPFKHCKAPHTISNRTTNRATAIVRNQKLNVNARLVRIYGCVSANIVKLVSIFHVFSGAHTRVHRSITNELSVQLLLTLLWPVSSANAYALHDGKENYRKSSSWRRFIVSTTNEQLENDFGECVDRRRMTYIMMHEKW